MVFHTTFILFGKFDPADAGRTFARDDSLDHESLRLAVFWDPLMVSAGCAPDELIAGFGNHFVLGLVIALGAVSGNKH